MADYDAVMQAYAVAKMVGDLFNVPPNWFMSPIFLTHLVVPLILISAFYYVILTRKVRILKSGAVNLVLSVVMGFVSIYAIVINYITVVLIGAIGLVYFYKGISLRSIIYMVIVGIALVSLLGFADSMIFRYFLY